jgi:CheY-like chemotaxis protein
MGGEIEVESELGRGTLFRIILPVAQPEMDRVSVKEGEKLAREGRRSGKILIIDDEDAILSMLEAALEGDHAIATARNAREAIQRLESSSEAFDLVLCDLMMPDMDGMRLFQELTARWPELEPKWAFITGGAVNQEIRSFVQNTTRPVLHKPFSLKVIREFVRSSLS